MDGLWGSTLQSRLMTIRSFEPPVVWGRCFHWQQRQGQNVIPQRNRPSHKDTERREDTDESLSGSVLDITINHIFAQTLLSLFLRINNEWCIVNHKLVPTCAEAVYRLITERLVQHIRVVDQDTPRISRHGQKDESSITRSGRSFEPWMQQVSSNDDVNSNVAAKTSCLLPWQLRIPKRPRMDRLWR